MATKLHAKDAKVGVITFGGIDSSGATLVVGGEYYQIVSLGDSSVSVLPVALSAGYPFWGDSTITLAVGDSVKKITLTELVTALTADINYTKETDEDTSQGDTAKSYQESEFSDIDVSINAYNSPDDASLKTLESHFVELITHTSSHAVTLSEVATATVWLIAKEREGDSVSLKVEKTAFIPLALSDVAKTINLISGPQEFNISAKGKGSEKPVIYYRIQP